MDIIALKKILDLENRFTEITTEEQQEAEVIDARDGEDSLNLRLDRDYNELSDNIAQNASKNGVLYAADYSGEDGGKQIQNALDVARGMTGHTTVVIGAQGPDVDNKWIVSDTILIPSDVTLIFINSYLELADGTNDNILRNENATNDGTVDENIFIYGIGRVVFDGNESGQENPRTEPNWKHIGLLYRQVDNFLTNNITMKNTTFWAMSHEDCWNGKIKDIHFDQNGNRPNQDGIDLRIGCKNIDIENITGRTGDDTIALSALQPEDGTDGYSYPEDGASQISNKTIEDRHITNISIKKVKTKVVGGHNTIRLLCSDGNRIIDIDVSNVKDITLPSDIVNSGNQISSVISINHGEYGETPPQNNELFNVSFRNISGFAESIIKVGHPFTKGNFENIRTLQTSGYSDIDSTYPQNIIEFAVADVTDNYGVFDNLTFNDVVMQHSYTGDWTNQGDMVKIADNNKLHNIVFNNPKIMLCTHVINAGTGVRLETWQINDPKITICGLEPFSVANASFSIGNSYSLISNLGSIRLQETAALYSGNFKFKLVGDCPPVTSDDEIPEPIVGSTVIFETGVNGFTNATYAMGDGTEWQAIVELTNY